MKRCPELQDLSREHHTALALVVRLKRAAASGDEAQVEAACRRTCEVFAGELLPHFHVEERDLLPALEAAGASAVVARTLLEHRALQRLVRELELPDPDVLLRFAELMSAHVRFEERELFEVAEDLLGREALARLLGHPGH
ncbi:hemerythrin domain-containing protein [Azospira restricta]|uniref:Hemerythrin domain-containing protein n=1 Tax=Azospira restricta TaxID=404405 RepID=A0A974Y5M5_9RHOO|nr:hemerythrin domain-containing protein [Azospira restricta]QRJ65523.1 hemerythrin domain-containing protein [Azospira restricta]